VTAGRHLVFPFLAAFLLTTKPEKSIADNITAAGVFQKHSKPVEKELFTRTNPMCELVEGIVTVPHHTELWLLSVERTASPRRSEVESA
jgi:hypothetical protein